MKLVPILFFAAILCFLAGGFGTRDGSAIGPVSFVMGGMLMLVGSVFHRRLKKGADVAR